MVLYPEVQRKAQEEIDGLLGRKRLPTLADRASMPYTEALVTELLRWAPPVPLSSYLSFYLVDKCRTKTGHSVALR